VRTWVIVVGASSALWGCGLEPLGDGQATDAPRPIPPNSAEVQTTDEGLAREEAWLSLGAPQGEISGCRAHWAGGHILLWAPNDDCVPHRRSWTKPSWISMSGDAAPQHDHWWAGTAMSELVVYGYTGDEHSVRRYDPDTDQWSASLPFSMGYHPEAITALSADDKLVLWGGFAHHELDPDQIVMPRFAKFRPDTDDWVAMSQEGMATPRYDHGAVWDSHHMFVFGGYDYQGNLLADGGVYDDGSEGWELVLTDGAPSPRLQPAVAWTGHIYVVFGGTTDGETFLDDGARYCPEPCWSWLPMEQPEDFAPRHPVALWAGEEVVVMQTEDAPLKMARYHPDDNDWSAVALPDELGDFVVLDAFWDWDTYRMILWGRHGCATAGCEARGAAEAWVYEPPLTVDPSEKPGANLAGNQTSEG
jgi:hypothetical protein